MIKIAAYEKKNIYRNWEVYSPNRMNFNSNCFKQLFYFSRAKYHRTYDYGTLHVCLITPPQIKRAQNGELNDRAKVNDRIKKNFNTN